MQVSREWAATYQNNQYVGLDHQEKEKSPKEDTKSEKKQTRNGELEKAKEKIKELSEALRIETLNSEEQMSYIAILRETMEQKLDGSGLLGILKELEPSPMMTIHDVVVELQETRAQRNSANKETAKALRKSDQFEDKVRQLQEKNEWLAGQVYDLESNEKTLKTELKSNKNALESLKYTLAENEELKKVLTGLRGEINSLRASKEKDQELVGTIEHENQMLAQEIEILKQKNESLALDAEEASIRISEAESNLSASRTKCEELIREKEKRTRSAEKLEKDLQSSQMLLRKSQTSDASKIQELEKYLKLQEKESIELAGIVRTLENELSATRTEIKTLRNQKEFVEREKNGKNQEIERLNEKLQNLQERSMSIEQKEAILKEEAFIISSTAKRLEESLKMEQMSKESIQQALLKEKSINQNLEKKLLAQSSEIQEAVTNWQELEEKQRETRLFVKRCVEELKNVLGMVKESLGLFEKDFRLSKMRNPHLTPGSKKSGKSGSQISEEEVFFLIDQVEMHVAQLKTDIGFYIQNPNYLRPNQGRSPVKNNSQSQIPIESSPNGSSALARSGLVEKMEMMDHEQREMKKKIEQLGLERDEMSKEIREKDFKIIHLQKEGRDMAIQLQKYDDPTLSKSIVLYKMDSEESRGMNRAKNEGKSGSGRSREQSSVKGLVPEENERERKRKEFLNEKTREVRIQELLGNQTGTIKGATPSHEKVEKEGEKEKYEESGFTKAVEDVSGSEEDYQERQKPERRPNRLNQERKLGNNQRVFENYERESIENRDIAEIEQEKTSHSFITSSPCEKGAGRRRQFEQKGKEADERLRASIPKEGGERADWRSPLNQRERASLKGGRSYGESRYYSLKESMGHGRISPS